MCCDQNGNRAFWLADKPLQSFWKPAYTRFFQKWRISSFLFDRYALIQDQSRSNLLNPELILNEIRKFKLKYSKIRAKQKI